MNVYEFESWSGVKQQVAADKVVFKPGHVLFLTNDLFLVLGERNPNVNHLKQLSDEPEAS
jgi:hypothetical protein